MEESQDFITIILLYIFIACNLSMRRMSYETL